jgi:hypothetical protein
MIGWANRILAGVEAVRDDFKLGGTTLQARR